MKPAFISSWKWQNPSAVSRAFVWLGLAVGWFMTGTLANGQWVAFNDQGWDGTNSRVTAYSLDFIRSPDRGPLINIDTGIPLAAVLRLSYSGTPANDLWASTSMAAPAPGTPAYTNFHPYIVWSDQRASGITLTERGTVTYNFSGLDPAKRYRFVGADLRGNTTPTPGNEYSNRWTTAELVGAAAYTPAHSSGVITSNQFPGALAGSQAAWNSGINTRGDVIDWTRITPAASGTFAVRCTKYNGPFPGGSGANSQNAYVFQAIRLEELATGPTAYLISPTNGAILSRLLPITVTANAAAPSGVSRVAFLVDGATIGEVTNSPYSLVWTNPAAGNHVLTAVVADWLGQTNTSMPVNITVISNFAPAVSLTSPTNGAQFLAGSDISLSATASDSDDAIGRVEFFANGAKLGEQTARPYILTWSNAALGTYSLTAVATDQGGVSSTSAPISVLVVSRFLPEVSLTSPANNALIISGTPIALVADASELSGTITNVAFFADGQELADVPASPYRFVWDGATLGGHTLRAVATDHYGTSATSAPVNIVVALSQWVAFNDQEQAGHPNDTTYSFGSLPGPIRNVDSGESLPVTLSITSTGSGDPPSYMGTMIAPANGTPAAAIFGGYIVWAGGANPGIRINPNTAFDYAFSGLDPNRRYRFVGASLRGGTAAASGNEYSNRWTQAELLGAVSYAPAHSANVITSNQFPGFLTGNQVAWSAGVNLTGDVVDWNNIAPSPAGTFVVRCAKYSGAFPGGNAANGQYSYAFQAIRLEEFLISGTAVQITSPTNNAVVVLPANLLVSANVSGFPGTVTNAAFYAGTTKLADATVSPFAFIWTNPPPDQYALRVVAADSTGLMATSAPVNIRVQTNTPPAVVIITPANGTVLNGPTEIPILVAATDSDGRITNVTVSANQIRIGEANAAPFNFSWPNVPVGTYDLTAVALDDKGAAATSSAVRVFVVASTAPTVVAWSPSAGVVSNLTQITVTFSEPVDGVDGADLLLNGAPASGVRGADTSYTFTFAPSAEGVVRATWAVNHGISDREIPSKPLDATAPENTAQFTLLDSVPPVVTQISPPPGVTVPSLTRVEVTFSEPVGGVQDEALLINGVPATKVSGSLAGPYRFEFNSPVSGLAQFSWATNHHIRDLAAAPNPFIGAPWTCVLDRAVAETNIVINEIMFHPSSERTDEEYLELFNRGTTPVDLTGWRLNRGIEFTFPAVTLPAGGYLVVAASTNAFAAKYPGVSNVMGNWTGRLRNSDDEIELENALGNQLDQVSYADEGDWAIRVRSTLSPPGWDWLSEADGQGKSLELINRALPNNTGQNWASSVTAQGTPGRANSVSASNVAPLILEVAHAPIVPRSTNTVAVTARILDEEPGVTVTLFYRNASSASPPAFISAPMFDDGLHSDGAAGDSVYAASLPALADKTVVEFYVQACDAGGRIRTWPAPARQSDGTTFAPTCNALYQVDNEAYAGSQPFLRMVMTESERSQLASLSRTSDAAMNATLLSVDGDGAKARYNVSIRYRGSGTRQRTPTNYRVNIPSDRRWNNVSEINLNTQFIHAQLAGSMLAQRAGLPCSLGRIVQVRINGVNQVPAGVPVNGTDSGAGFGSYILLEPPSAEWAGRQFPLDGAGNVYRAADGWGATLDYRGTNPASYYPNYVKVSNQSENDWSDLIRLCYALRGGLTGAAYLQAVRTNLNVQLALRYFAVCALLEYMENGLPTGEGDDYSLYRGLNDPRFLFIPHDFDTVLAQGDGGYNPSPTVSIWYPITRSGGNMAPALAPFIRHNEFAPVYFEELKRLLETTFAAAQLNPFLDQILGGWVPEIKITEMKTFAAGRVANVWSQIPTNFSVSVPLSRVNGYYQSLSPTVQLTGRANALTTRSVTVNGAASLWSAWEGRWTNAAALQPGLNRVLVQAWDANHGEVFRQTEDVWYDDGTTTDVAGTLTTDTVWTPANGPYRATANLTVASGATLTILPGTTVYLGSAVNVIVADGGRLLAEGTAAAPIRFTRPPGTTNNWGHLTINGSAGSPETRLAYAHFEFNAANLNSACLQVSAGTVFLDQLTFGNTAAPYLHLDGASFTITDCVFPTATACFELIHGTGGIKAGGRGLFLRNFFGAALSTPASYNDVIDFTRGNRPGQPIAQFINNVFAGSGDDLLDLDGTDAWIEGNIFLHAHKNGSPDTASGVSGGGDSGQTSEITILGNIFYDCDQAAMAKEGNFFTLLHNTIVHQTHQGGLDTTGAVVCLADAGTTQGAGMYLEGNIIFDAEQLVRNATTALVTLTNNLMSPPWSGPGGGNATNDPLLKYIPQLAETAFTNWQQAQVLWDWFSLRPGSPALGANPNGRDLGAVSPSPLGGERAGVRGVSLSGAPLGTTSQTNATLHVGLNCTGNGIPTAGWPDGSGYTHYQWRLDGGVWSAQTPILSPIRLTGLSPGPHAVEVVGRNDAGLYQNDPVLGAEAVVTSCSWIVNPSTLTIRLNEILAGNQRAAPVGGRYPDLIELLNTGASSVDLAGMSITDDRDDPRKFTFPPSTVVNPGQFLVLYADNDSAPPGLHLGFALKQEGDAVYLFTANGRLLDSVSFGSQLTDFSIGCLADGHWALAQPTFGAKTLPANTGDPHRLRLNEWLAHGVSPISYDFVELFNADPLPVDLSGVFLTGNPIGAPRQQEIAPLSFIPGGGYSVFYGVQAKDFSLGRVPSGSTNWVLAIPTPGSLNIVAALGDPMGLRFNEWMANPTSGDDWFEVLNPSAQPVALGGLYFTDDLRTPASRRKHPIAPRSFIGSGLYGYERFIADDNAVAGPDHVAFGLKASGESLGLYTAADVPIDTLNFGPQGAGVSEGRLPDGTTNATVRFATTPTPGDANYLPLTTVVISEVLSASEPPFEDAIELQNVSDAPVDLRGWWISDAPRTLKKFQITNDMLLPAGGFAVFYENQFNLDPNEPASFSLDSTSGDQVYLSEATPNGDLTGYRAVAEFGPAETGVSFGRYTNSLGRVDFVALSRRTFSQDNPASVEAFRLGTGGPNAYPKVGPIVFTEIMYHPPDLGGMDNVRDEYLELFNTTSNTVPLYDPANPQNTWRLRGGVDLEFPTNVSLAPGGYLLAVSFNPVNDTNALAGFRAAYPQMATGAILCGPYRGKQDNGGGSVALEKPAPPEGGMVAFILVERVRYDDQTPWDPLADGAGRSLERVSPVLYGNDPANWRASTPTFGFTFNPDADSDRDGIPDRWMMQHFGHLTGQADDNSLAHQDADRNGMSNLNECHSGTDPRDPHSGLRLDAITSPAPGNQVTLVFQVVSNLTYTIESTDRMTPPLWTRLYDIEAATTNRLIVVPVPPDGLARFYRLRTPKLPPSSSEPR